MRALDDSDNTSDSCSTSSASIDASDAGSDGMASDDNAPDTVNHRTVERRNSATTETYPCAEDALFEDGHRDSVPLESPDADSTHGCLNDNEPLDDRPPNSPTHHTVDGGTEGTRISNWSTSVKSGYGILSATSMESLHRKEFVYDGGGVAGAPVGAVGADATTYDPLDYGFKSEFDYAFSMWLHKVHCTKGDVTNLCSDPRLAPLVDMLSFNNGKKWNANLDRLPTGIDGNGFKKEKMSWAGDQEGVPPHVHDVVYRDVVEVVRFLIGHTPFKNDMQYAPTRLYRDETCQVRVYSEMNTGDWWWDTQGKLPSGATVVPILIAVDKTLMTMLHGDTVCWPVYLTIGNIDRSVRRARERCGIALVGFVPIVDSKDPKTKTISYHDSMAKILKPLEEIAKNGEIMTCADGHDRRCYTILSGIIADYQEQTLITGVKSNRHCTICTVPPNERENLCGEPWPARTHEGTKAQIEKQRRQKVDPSSDDYVHDVECFAWRHPHFNVHDGMLVDTLHQLLKGLVMYNLQWIQKLVGEVIPKSRKQRGKKRTTAESGGQILLDERFKAVPKYTGLKVWKTGVSRISQWTGDEQKAIVRQLVPVITPLLIDKEPFAIHFTRAVCDFVTLAMYRTHDDETLKYLQDALRRIDALKDVFRSFRPRSKQGELNGHFNIPKLHALVHWAYFIKSRGSPDGYDTGPNGEAVHMFLLKVNFNLTNKRDHVVQLGNLADRAVSVRSMESHVVAQRSVPTTAVTKAFDDLYISTPSGAVKVETMGWDTGRTTPQRGTWITIDEATKASGIEDLADILAVFIRNERERRGRLNGKTRRKYTNHQKSVDRDESVFPEQPDWMEDMRIQVHPSMKCWYKHGKDCTNTEAMDSQLVRCTRWEGVMRRDHVMVVNIPTGERHNPNPANPAERLHGRSVGRVDLIFTVEDGRDPDNGGEKKNYTGVIVNRYEIQDNGIPHKVHGMIEVLEREVLAPTPELKLGSRRAFSLPMVKRSLHLVPSGLSPGHYYINNYIDFEIYNTLYSPNFKAEGDAVIEAYNNHKESTRDAGEGQTATQNTRPPTKKKANDKSNAKKANNQARGKGTARVSGMVSQPQDTPETSDSDSSTTSEEDSDSSEEDSDFDDGQPVASTGGNNRRKQGPGANISRERVQPTAKRYQTRSSARRVVESESDE